MRLVLVRRPGNVDEYVNPEQVTHIEAVGKEEYTVHFVGGGHIKITKEGLEALLKGQTESQPHSWKANR